MHHRRLRVTEKIGNSSHAAHSNIGPVVERETSVYGTVGVLYAF